MTALAIDRRRLGNLLGMIGSNADGEALNPALLADRMVREARTTWHTVLGTDVAPEPDRPRVDGDDDFAVVGRLPGGWRQLARDCVKHGRGILTDWEQGFVESLTGRKAVPSPKQAAILRRLAEKMVLEGTFAR